MDGKPVLNATDNVYGRGMAGLRAGSDKDRLSTPYFDNLLINGINAPAPEPTKALPGQSPIYGISDRK